LFIPRSYDLELTLSPRSSMLSTNWVPAETVLRVGKVMNL